MSSLPEKGGSWVWINQGSFQRLSEPLETKSIYKRATSGTTTLYYAPTAAQAFLLALIRYRESDNNYTALNDVSTASGGYQFIDGTWAAVAKATGVGTAYARAYLAPSVDQDYNALWLLNQYGPNSSFSWKASGPYPTLDECDFAIGFA